MMKTMKRFLCLLPLAGALACAADLAGVHTVYLLPMARGMDQYLANQLTNGHVFVVVTDPKLADAILTDHVTEGFQSQLEGISPTPKPPEPEKKAAPEPAADADDESAPPAKPAAVEPAAKADDKPAMSTKPVVTADDKPAPPSKPAVAEPAVKADADAEPPAKPARSRAKAKPEDESHTPALLGKTENTLSNPAASSGFSRARGTVFLVDSKSRQVIWSIYAPPRNFAGKEMNRTASDIVSRLKHDLKPKK
jgi:outer membrane biosynthesis protein TonB